jgi:starch-binding outer membrane protein, SusD/RagB family
MKKILYTAFYFCSALLLNSCIGDLDQYPHEDETSSTIYTNAENYKAVLGKIYAAMVVVSI